MHARLFASLLAFVIGATSTGTSEAWSKRAQWFFKPHIGVAYQALVGDLEEVTRGTNASIDYDNYLDNTYHGYILHFGARIHNRIGIEVSYFDTFEESTEISEIPTSRGGVGYAGEFDSQFSGINYDLMYFYRFANKWEWILSLGVADWDLDIKTTPARALGNSDILLEDGSDTFGRYGAGLQYHISKRLAIRGMAHYLDSDWEAVNNPWTAAVGLQLTF